MHVGTRKIFEQKIETAEESSEDEREEEKSLRMLTGKKYPQIKLQCLRKV